MKKTKDNKKPKDKKVKTEKGKAKNSNKQNKVISWEKTRS